MNMFVQVSEHRIVPTGNIVDISVFPARPLRVDIVTTASESYYDDGGDYPEQRHADIRPYTITLRGAEAQTFLDALPTYSPEPDEGADTEAADRVMADDSDEIIPFRRTT